MLNKSNKSEIIPTDTEHNFVHKFYNRNYDNFSDIGKTRPCVQNYIDKQSPNKNIFGEGCGKNMLYAKNKGTVKRN